MSLRPCDHASGYCKDTAHKYEQPDELAPRPPRPLDHEARRLTIGADPEE